MSIGREIKRRCKAAIPPLIFLGLVGYFGWSATQGNRGLQAYALRQAQLRNMQADLGKATAEQAVWERKVMGLRTTRLDPDTLDERARAMLNLADPTDVVVMYGPGKNLF
jgi:cell division protein FtsB